MRKAPNLPNRGVDDRIPRSGNQRWLHLTVAAGLLMGTGCAGMGSEAQGSSVLPGVEVSHEVQYNDIPDPFQFEFDNERSWQYRKFETGAIPFRSAELIYWGDSPIRHLASWYEDQMPRHGWEYVSTREADSIRVLFNKGIEQAEIKLERIIARNGQEQITKVTCRIRAR